MSNISINQEKSFPLLGALMTAATRIVQAPTRFLKDSKTVSDFFTQIAELETEVHVPNFKQSSDQMVSFIEQAQTIFTEASPLDQASIKNRLLAERLHKTSKAKILLRKLSGSEKQQPALEKAMDLFRHMGILEEVTGDKVFEKRVGDSIRLFLAKTNQTKNFSKTLQTIEISNGLEPINKASDIFHNADAETQRAISLKVKNEEIGLAARILLGKINQKQYLGFEALAKLYIEMGVLGYINAHPLGKKQSYGQVLNQNQGYEILQRVMRETQSIHKKAKPIDKRPAAPKPSSPASV